MAAADPSDRPDDPPAAEAGIDDPAVDADTTSAPASEGLRLTAEELVGDLERVAAERDQYLDLARRTQAEFENFRKRTAKQLADEVAREAGRLVQAVLPVLDAFDYAVAHGEAGATALREQLVGVLAKEGLDRIDPDGEPFDPSEHDAVAHEPGDHGPPVVAETLRAGYRWRGSLLRPAMVRVRD